MYIELLSPAATSLNNEAVRSAGDVVPVAVSAAATLVIDSRKTASRPYTSIFFRIFLITCLLFLIFGAYQLFWPPVTDLVKLRPNYADI